MTRAAVNGRVASTRAITDPTGISGLEAWHRADQGITIATGVSQWNDLSGNTHHLVQATAGSQPLFVASAINGQPAVRFDGTDDYLRLVYTLNQPETVVIVYKSVVVGASGVHDVVCDGTSAFSMATLSTTEPAFKLFAGATLTYSASVGSGSYVYAVMTFMKTSSSIRVNGVDVARGDGGASNAGGLTLGASGAAQRPANVEIAEIALYSRALAAGDISRLEAYITSRYALS